MIRFETLLEKVRSYSPEADLELLRRAYVFSALEHKGQVRHSGEPYLIHPLEVADSLADMKLDVVAVAAGLLHDVVEDTLTTPERIAELFGPEIAHVVEGVTKIGAIPFSSSEERQAENFRKMLLAMVDDIRVILVKLADRLHNMRTLQHLPEERRVKIAQETLDIYAPIANRLGMSKVKNELEELSFKYLEPKAYDALRAKVEAKRKSAEAVIDELTRTLRSKLEDAQVPIITLDGRIKRLYSIHNKLKRQKIDLERVYDFVALRVTTQSVKDCYAALGIIHQTWSPVPGRIKDFIAMPRPNGYQSLHTSVISEQGFPFEVQIRTDEMHRRAEEGVAAHWKYKEGRVGDHRDERYFQWMRQLLEVQQEVRDPREFLQNLKIDLYPEEVYIFTPKGEVRSLPRGATRGRFRVHRAHRRRPPVRRRAHQRPHGAAAHEAAERRHHRDRHAVRAQAEPRLADVCRDVARPQQDQARPAHRGAGAQHRAGPASVRQGSAAVQSQSRRRCSRVRSSTKFATEYGAKTADELLAHIGYGKLSARTVLQKSVPAAQLHEASPVVSMVRRVLRPGTTLRQDQGPRRRRCDGVPRQVLQSDSRREDRRLHHARQGRVGALAGMSERVESDVRSRSPHRGRVGQRRHRSGSVCGAAHHAGRGSQGHARGDQREDLRHQHQHHQHGSAHRRGSAGAHRYDG